MRKCTLIAIVLFVSANIISQSSNPKRGISFGNPSIQAADLETMAGHLSWFYNWGTAPPSNVINLYGDYDIDFVPMAWNGGVSDENLRAFYSSHPDEKYLLGFNEPNFRDQANMTPTQAAAEWHRLEAIAAEFDLEIVGPAVNWCGNCVSENGTTYYNPYDYLDDFFAACTDCKVDYIAVHNYMCSSGALAGYLDEFKKYGKKIWLTEFACLDDQTITLDKQKSLMLGALDYLDNDTMIFRYAWFLARTGSGDHIIDIFKTEAGKLTELGEIYLNFDASHDTTLYRKVPSRIEAESYSKMSGVQMEGTADFDGVANVGWIDGGDWLEYNIDVPAAGEYFLYLRISANENTSAEILVNDILIETLSIPSTGGWQKWKTFGTQIYLDKGIAKLRLSTGTGSFNVNWLTFSGSENHPPTVYAGRDTVLLAPVSSVQLAAIGEDSNGDELVYRWTKVSGAACTIGSPDSETTMVSGLVKGTYRFRVTVSDSIELAQDDVNVIVEESTGIESTDNGANARIFPNPVNDLLYISLPGYAGNCRVELLNSNGQLIYLNDFKSQVGDIEVDFNPLKKGMYILKLEYSDRILVHKILK